MSNKEEVTFPGDRIDRNLMMAISMLSDVQENMTDSEEDDGMVERVDQSKQVIIEVMEDRRKKRVAT